MKKLSSTGATATLLLLLMSQRATAQVVDSHPESRTIFQVEQLSGIGTSQTIYTSKLLLDGKCKEKVEAYLQSVPNIQSFVVNPYTIDIQWSEPTTDNIIFFYEKLEFQYIFPYTSKP